MPKQSRVRYDASDDGIARIELDRPEKRNAQDVDLLYDLQDAFHRAAQDDMVKVIILAGNGIDFSAGHDLSVGLRGNTKGIGEWGGTTAPGSEGVMAAEQEMYLGLCRRWRDLPKPTIAEVHGRAIAAGLMLAWVCDLIVCSQDAKFRDHTVTFGCSGAEWFVHPWEVGHRKAKEMLFTADWLSAEDAYRLGMVNHVVPREELRDFTRAMAARIAKQPSFALKLAKSAVNQAVDIQGQAAAIQAGFGLHQLAHAHNLQRFGAVVDPNGLPEPYRSQIVERSRQPLAGEQERV